MMVMVVSVKSVGEAETEELRDVLSPGSQVMEAPRPFSMESSPTHLTLQGPRPLSVDPST